MVPITYSQYADKKGTGKILNQRTALDVCAYFHVSRGIGFILCNHESETARSESNLKDFFNTLPNLELPVALYACESFAFRDLSMFTSFTSEVFFRIDSIENPSSLFCGNYVGCEEGIQDGASRSGR